jgi:hypothetical protein
MTATPHTPQPPCDTLVAMWTLTWPDGNVYTAADPDSLLECVTGRPDCPDDMGDVLNLMHAMSYRATGIGTIWAGTTAQHLWRLHELGVFHVKHSEVAAT